jgi:hypothetical protein
MLAGNPRRNSNIVQKYLRHARREPIYLSQESTKVELAYLSQWQAARAPQPAKRRLIHRRRLVVGRSRKLEKKKAPAKGPS